MHVRLTTATGVADLDEAAAHLREQTTPLVRQQKGFRGITASGDRTSRRITVITLWETKEDLDASESASDKARDEAMKALGGEHVTIERFEQALFERGEVPPRPGSKVFVRYIEMDPASVDENLRHFKGVVAPDIMAEPGCLGVRFLIDRATGEGRVGTLWADQPAMDAHRASTEENQARAAEHGVTFKEDLTAEVLFAEM